MSTRDEIAADVRENLDDAGVTFYSATDITDSLQDGYDDIAVISGCIQKTATVSFAANLSYYNFLSSITDYYATVAIYNNNTNRWLDAESRKSLDKIRRDVELWSGEPQFFVPIDHKYVMLVPRLSSASGNCTVHYKATAPTMAGSDTPLIHTDEQILLEYYATADLLDQAQEYRKAEIWWKQYFEGVLKYKSRVSQLAKSDYLPILALS